MSANPNSTREAFEQWVDGEFRPFIAKRSSTGKYQHFETQKDWELWQKAVEWSRSHALEEAAKVAENQEEESYWEGSDYNGECKTVYGKKSAEAIRKLKDQA